MNTVYNDTQNIIIAGTNSLNEGGNGSITVRLTQEPSSNVTVSLSSSIPSSLSLGTSTLTFTPANYSTAQTVAVNALQDDNQTSETAIISATASGITTATWNLVCIEDDTTIVFGTGSSVNEGGTITLGITLSGNPGTNRTVSFSSGNTGSLTVSPSTMNFTTSNFGTTQALTITGVEDANIIAETVTITASGTGLISSTKVVTTVDNDTMNLTLGGANTVNEGSTSTMTVALTQDPSGSLTVNLSSGDTTSVSVSPSTLTFTSANYSTPQNVTLTGVEDANETSETVTITASASGVSSQTRSIVAIENDTRPTFAGASSVTEGNTATLSVTLSGNPGTSRTVNLSSINTSSLTLSPSTLNFTQANWNSAQTITLTGVQDSNAIGETVTITASGTGLVTSTRSITLVDDDTQSIVLSRSGNTIDEGSSTNTFTVRLSYDPVNSYQVSLASSNTASVTVSPATLTFTSANYITPQTVTLSGVEDANETSESITITASGTGVTNQTLAYTTIENDTTITFGTPTGYEGINVTIPITLSGNPGASRTVNFSSNNNPPTVSPSSMTFTTSNFNTPQTLTLTGLTDANTTSVITAQDSNQASSTKLLTKTWNANTAKYSIGGTVSGLIGNLILINKGSYDTTTVSSNGNFSFSKTASTYAVAAKYYLLGKICLISNANGIATSAITNIGIACTTKSYTLGEGGSGLLATGQTTSYASGDDGTYQGTLKRSYTDNGDGTVTDNVTGLIYQKCSIGLNNDSSCSGTATKTSWSSAGTYCVSLTLAGKTWRLPTVNELANLVDYGKSAPTIDTTAFPGTQSSYYWSSSTYAQDTNGAWLVYFTDGDVDYGGKAGNGYVRCVTGP